MDSEKMELLESINWFNLLNGKVFNSIPNYDDYDMYSAPSYSKYCFALSKHMNKVADLYLCLDTVTKAMTKYHKSIISDTSQRFIYFQAEEGEASAISDIPQVRGIYKIYQKINENYELIYIGISDNIRKRINQHCYAQHILCKDMFEHKTAIVKYEILEDFTKDELLLREHYYIFKFKPKYNLVHSTGKYV